LLRLLGTLTQGEMETIGRVLAKRVGL
jgi:hypothetical protein